MDVDGSSPARINRTTSANVANIETFNRQSIRKKSEKRPFSSHEEDEKDEEERGALVLKDIGQESCA